MEKKHWRKISKINRIENFVHQYKWLGMWHKCKKNAKLEQKQYLNFISLTLTVNE